MSNTKNFGLISEIKIDEPSTWLNKKFLTFDIDWANDDIIIDTISILEKHEVKATWFVTHQTKVLEKLRKSNKFELGIHPNFNNLLNGAEKNNSEEIIKSLKDIVPEATALRSHSLTQSERLLDLFSEFGLKNICNTFIPSSIKTKITPWKLWSGIQIIPHCWQDNVSFKISLESKPIFNDSIVVYNFHPIHVFLNSENMERYESSRQFHKNIEKLRNHCNQREGVRNFLLDLIKKLK